MGAATGALLVLAVSVVPAAAQLSEPHVVRPTATPCLNVRPSPDTDANLATCLLPGTLVTATGAVRYWREIQLADGSTGWAAKKFLEPVSAPTPSTGAVSIPADAFLEVHFVDVGQGDAIWINTHDDGVDGNGVFEGRNVVIDGGPQSADHSNQFRLYLEARAHHDAVIDAAILSHPHDDHYPGLDGIRRHFDVLRYYDPGFPKGGLEYPAYLAAMQAETGTDGPIKTHMGIDQFGDLRYLGGELEAEFLHSWPGAEGEADLGSGSTLENNASVVLRLAYGDHVFIFMGDAEGKDRDDDPEVARYVERRLLDEYPPEFLDATVLKVAHHGSETSSTNEFVRVVSPEIVVVQSGRRTYSGRTLPDATVLERYCQSNSDTKIHRTDEGDAAAGLTAANDEDGDHVVIRTNGSTIQVEALEGGAPIGGRACSRAHGRRSAVTGGAVSCYSTIAATAVRSCTSRRRLRARVA